MEEFLGFEIDPEELPFWDEDDLGEDEPRLVEWAVKKLKEFKTIDVINMPRFRKAMTLVNAIVASVKEYSESATYDVAFETVLGKDLVLRVVAGSMPFDEDVVAGIRKLDDDMIRSIDIDGRLDGRAELTISFKDVKARAVNQ